jgi:hypothetical protein
LKPLAAHTQTITASITAYNDKNWSKAKDSLAADAVCDEKGTHRRIQGAGEIIEAWQSWAKAFPDSKATFVREFASGDTAVLEIVWKGVHSGPLQTPTGIIPASNKSIEMPACQVVQVEGGKIRAPRTTSTCSRCSLRSVPRLALQRERESRSIQLKKPAGGEPLPRSRFFFAGTALPSSGLGSSRRAAAS